MNTEAGNRARSRGVGRWPWVVLALLLAWQSLGTVTVRGADDPAEGVTPPLPIAEVAVRDNYFDPSVLELPLESTIVWIWDGVGPHNIVSTEFGAPVQTSGVFSFAFTSPGTYDYVCTLHRGMHGRVLVLGSQA